MQKIKIYEGDGKARIFIDDFELQHDMAVTILGIKYEVVEKIEIEKGNLLLGQIDFINQKIYIRKDLSKEQKRITLLHEIIHGIFNQLGFDEYNDDEKLIKCLSTSLVSFVDKSII